MEETTKKIAIAVVVVLAVSLISTNLGITGEIVRADEPNSLSVTQIGTKITVELKYTVGYGQPGKIVDMRSYKGVSREDATTKCESGEYAARGTSRCKREVAKFDITGQRWSAGDLVVFSVRNTDVQKQYRIK